MPHYKGLTYKSKFGKTKDYIILPLVGSRLQTVPLILLVLFYVGFSFGYANVPFALMGELFPASVSNVANT